MGFSKKNSIKEFKKIALMLPIYSNNSHYFGAFKPEKMREVIGKINSLLQEKATIQQKQLKFLKIRNKTLARIYSVADKNLKSNSTPCWVSLFPRPIFFSLLNFFKVSEK